MARQRPAAGTAHLLVDVAVVDAVEHRRRAGRERAADDGGDDEPERRDAAGGEEHHRHGGEQQQLDDPRLGQPDVRRDDVARRSPRGGSGCREQQRPTGRRTSRGSSGRCWVMQAVGWWQRGRVYRPG